MKNASIELTIQDKPIDTEPQREKGANPLGSVLLGVFLGGFFGFLAGLGMEKK
jgi:hypothetical protein